CPYFGLSSHSKVVGKLAVPVRCAIAPTKLPCAIAIANSFQIRCSTDYLKTRTGTLLPSYIWGEIAFEKDAVSEAVASKHSVCMVLIVPCLNPWGRLSFS
ncbi:MAG TPA: hypothetical protein V6D02_00460, partial [Candidatus Obscuribacterales bacterium]